MAWQWANLEQVLDPWLATQSDEDTTRRVLKKMADMAENPDFTYDGRTFVQSPLVEQLVVPGTGVVIVYLRAEQFHTFRLITLTEI